MIENSFLKLYHSVSVTTLYYFNSGFLFPRSQQPVIVKYLLILLDLRASPSVVEVDWSQERWSYNNYNQSNNFTQTIVTTGQLVMKHDHLYFQIFFSCFIMIHLSPHHSPISWRSWSKAPAALTGSHQHKIWYSLLVIGLHWTLNMGKPFLLDLFSTFQYWNHLSLSSLPG